MVWSTVFPCTTLCRSIYVGSGTAASGRGGSLYVSVGSGNSGAGGDVMISAGETVGAVNAGAVGGQILLSAGTSGSQTGGRGYRVSGGDELTSSAGLAI